MEGDTSLVDTSPVPSHPVPFGVAAACRCLPLALRLNVSERTAKQKCKLLIEARPASPQHEAVASTLRLDLPGVQLRGVARALDGIWELWSSSGFQQRINLEVVFCFACLSSAFAISARVWLQSKTQL